MSANPTGKRIGRSILAVFVGVLVNVIPAVAIDGVLHATGVYPPFGQTMSTGLFLLATSYRVLLGIAGAYVTARLAPRRPVFHALVLGGIGVAMCAVGTITMKDAGPIWYPLLLIAITLPCSLLGGKMAEKISSGAKA